MSVIIARDGRLGTDEDGTMELVIKNMMDSDIGFVSCQRGNLVSIFLVDSDDIITISNVRRCTVDRVTSGMTDRGVNSNEAPIGRVNDTIPNTPQSKVTNCDCGTAFTIFSVSSLGMGTETSFVPSRSSSAMVLPP